MGEKGGGIGGVWVCVGWGWGDGCWVVGPQVLAGNMFSRFKMAGIGSFREECRVAKCV